MASVQELAHTQRLLEGRLIALAASTSKGLDPTDANSYLLILLAGRNFGL